MTERKPKRSFLGLAKAGFAFGDGELAGVAAFLCNRHAPLTFDDAPETRAEPVTPTAPARRVEQLAPQAPDYRCKTCQSTNLEMRWGHSYYFKCLDCGGNTSISRSCVGCGEKERIRKEGPKFFGECTLCGRSDPFFVNPS